MAIPDLHQKKKLQGEKSSKSQIFFLTAFLKEISFIPDLLINDYVIEFLKNNHEKTFQRIKKVLFLKRKVVKNRLLKTLKI